MIRIVHSPAILKKLSGLYCHAKGLIGCVELSHTAEELESLLDAEQQDDPKTRDPGLLNQCHSVHALK